jgi:hypothetical protein
LNGTLSGLIRQLRANAVKAQTAAEKVGIGKILPVA